MPQLRPTYALTLGNGLWDRQVLALDLTLTLAPGIDRLEAVLPPEAPFDAAPGEPCSLTLGNGEREEAMFTGVIRSVAPSLHGWRVVAVNAGGRMSAIRPAVTFEGVSAGRVVRDLASEAEVETGAVTDGVDLAFYVADPARTAWEHVARLAAMSAAFARVGADGALEVFEIGAGTADTALAHGRDLLRLTHRERDDAGTAFRVCGEAMAGTASAPEALRPIIDPLDGDAPAPDRRILFRPALRTPDGASMAGAGLTRAHQATSRQLAFQGWLQPQLRPGQRIELQGLPDSVATGAAWAETVRHLVTPSGARSHVTANRDPDGFDPLALLGSLGGALSAVF